MRILVTGGSGFVGNQLVRRLLVDGHSVHLILKPGFRSWRMEDIRDRVSIHEGDIANEAFVTATVKEVAPEWIFNSATYGAYASETDFTQMTVTNIIGLHHLLQAAASNGCSSFINVASCVEYGERATPPVETDQCAPSTPYGITRLAGTNLCMDVAARTGLNAATLRLYSTYGPFEDPRRLITQLCLTAKSGSLSSVNSATTAHDYTYIDDVVDALIAAAKSDVRGKVFNVGSGVATTGADIAAEVATIVGAESPALNSNRPRTKALAAANATKIRRELGWEPVIDLRDGLTKTIEWLDNNAEVLPGS